MCAIFGAVFEPRRSPVKCQVFIDVPFYYKFVLPIVPVAGVVVICHVHLACPYFKLTALPWWWYVPHSSTRRTATKPGIIENAAGWQPSNISARTLLSRGGWGGAAKSEGRGCEQRGNFGCSGRPSLVDENPKAGRQ